MVKTKTYTNREPKAISPRLIIRELISMVEAWVMAAKEVFAINKKVTNSKQKKRYRLTQREFIQTAPVKNKKFLRTKPNSISGNSIELG